jgi:hypothetical protein
MKRRSDRQQLPYSTSSRVGFVWPRRHVDEA